MVDQPDPVPGPASGTGVRGGLRSLGTLWGPALWLAVCAGLLLAGGLVHLAGAPAAASWLWAASALAALVPLLALSVIGVARGRFGVDLLALLALAGTLAIREYLAAAVLSVMVSGGRAIEARAEHRATRELRALRSRAPTTAHLLDEGGITTVPSERVEVGALVVVKPGEVVPVDGRLVGTAAVLDESALTGESRPVEREPDDLVLSGVTNGGGAVTLRAVHSATDSTYAGVVRLVDQARANRAPIVRLADRIAVVFTPVALAIAAISWIVTGQFERAVAVLVVATPCPLILAAPIAVVSGISRATRHGVVVKDGGSLEGLAQGSTVLLDKTGTLTSGRPQVADVEVAPGVDVGIALGLAASVDQVSSHVLAAALVDAAKRRLLPMDLPTDVHEEAGRGISGRVNGSLVAVGRGSWVAPATPDWAARVRRRTAREGLANVFVAVDGAVVAVVVVDDPIRVDAARTVRLLRGAGIRRVVMLTGDHPEVAEVVGAATGMDDVLADCSPSQKVAAVREESSRGPTIMVGDGINDAPALAAAEVGVVMGARGATAASEAGDVVIVSDRLERLAEGVVIARRSRRIALQSATVGMALAGMAMALAAFGLLVPIVGAIVQEAIDVVVILYALRCPRWARTGQAREGSGGARRPPPPGARPPGRLHPRDPSDRRGDRLPHAGGASGSNALSPSTPHGPDPPARAGRRRDAVPSGGEDHWRVGPDRRHES